MPTNYAADVVLRSTAAPTGTFSGGELYFNTTTNVLMYYNGSAWLPVRPVDSIRWSIAGALSVANGALRLPLDFACTMVNLRAMVNTAPTGAALNIRVNKNGSSAATVSISATTNSATTTESVSLAAGDYLTVDVTQVGSTVAGSDLVVSMMLQAA